MRLHFNRLGKYNSSQQRIHRWDGNAGLGAVVSMSVLPIGRNFAANLFSRSEYVPFNLSRARAKTYLLAFYSSVRLCCILADLNDYARTFSWKSAAVSRVLWRDLRVPERGQWMTRGNILESRILEKPVCTRKKPTKDLRLATVESYSSVCPLK